ncbi:LuxR C-terminal-related transcriptional regulator [Methyloglobulus sp.]|uniref:LuxR C-terminal-related transcriptional regulator n=1 Tax=Methyloglobulus sp. TaxID=2518622 RepID=UPI0032B85708
MSDNSNEINQQLHIGIVEQIAQVESTNVPIPIVDEFLCELGVRQIVLEMQNEELRQTIVDLETSRLHYLELYEFAPVAYLTLTPERVIAEINVTGAKLFGVERKEIVNRYFAEFIADDYKDHWHRYELLVKQQDCQHSCELLIRREDGINFYAHIESRYQEEKCTPLMRVTLTDITERKQAEEVLRFIAVAFEPQASIIVDDAHKVILRANQVLNILLDARQRLEKEAVTSKSDIKKIKEETAEINAVLNVLIKHRETDIADTKMMLSGEVENTIMPFLQKLKGASAGRLQTTRLIDILEANLKQMVKVYGNAANLPSAYQQLTPTQIQVASMVRQGLSTKAIAVTLNSSPETVNIHRKHIRKKLGLDNKASSLRSYLLSLTE